MDKVEARGTIASATPGRVRIRLHRTTRSQNVVNVVKQHVTAQNGVNLVDANAATGSIVVHFDQKSTSLDDIIAMLHDVGVVVASIADLEDDIDLGVGTPASRRVIEAIDRLDRRIAETTGQAIDLRLLFPAGLFALGLRQVMVEGLGLTQVPGYVLLWYAFDAFWKLHRDLTRGAAAEVAESAVASLAGTTPGAGEAPDSRSESGRG